jgi:lipopolysaccharide transport system permease protein
MPNEQDWTLVIQPKAKWFDLHLHDLWHYRDLIMLFVWRDFVAQYKQTILGPLWFIIQPLMTTIMFTIVFGNIAQLPTDGLPKMLFYLSGNVVWGYFANCLNSTSNTFVANAGLFGKVYFPRLAVPVSIVISQLFTFGLQLMLFIAFLAYFAWNGAAVHPNTVIFLTPLLVLLMASLGLGTGIIFSALTTKYRDLRFLLAFGVQLLMYATPVIYPLSAIPGKYRFFILANPMTPIIETFRYGFLGSGTFDPIHLAYSTAFTAAMLSLGILLFSRIERTFMDTV